MSTPSGRWAASAVACVLVAASQAACVRSGVRDSIDEYSKQDNWQKLREPAEELARAVAHGVVGGVGDQVDGEQLAGAIDTYVTAFIAAASRELDADLGPAVARQVRGAVAATVDELLAEPVV